MKWEHHKCTHIVFFTASMDQQSDHGGGINRELSFWMFSLSIALFVNELTHWLCQSSQTTLRH